MAPVHVVDERQITGLDPALQRRMANSQKTSREALRNRFAGLSLQVGTNRGEIRIPRRMALSPAESGDLL